MLPAASSDPGPEATSTSTNVQPTTKYTSAVFRLARQPCCSLIGSWQYSTILGDYGMSAPASPRPVEVFSTSMLPGVTVSATPLPVGLPSFSFLNMGSVNTNRPCLWEPTPHRVAWRSGHDLRY